MPEGDTDNNKSVSHLQLRHKMQANILYFQKYIFSQYTKQHINVYKDSLRNLLCSFLGEFACKYSGNHGILHTMYCTYINVYMN